jgi:UDP-N-acetylmuramoyl-tripeptide--D-alanyl-D-alanine ligase
MGFFTVEELREVISVKVLTGQDSLSGKRRIRQISTDSRSVRRGDLFVALRGDRFDGHKFVPAVFAQGAAGAIVHDEYRLPSSFSAVRRIERQSAPFLFGVRDPLLAYQQLATPYPCRGGDREQRQDHDERDGGGGVSSTVAGVEDGREF